MKKKNINERRALLLACASALTLSMTGCNPKELSSDKSNIDMLDTNSILEDENATNINVSQELEVDKEDFKLAIEYSFEKGSEWRITDTKRLYMDIKTIGLPDDKEVYIDNIHSDTYIVSTKALYNGILQDTMDDHIHNSLMFGFPISDKSSYFGCNTIEGQNSEFLEGWTYGYKGDVGGEVETKRRLESDFLEKGVYANQIESVIDLIVVDKKNTGEYRAVSVSSSVLIKVNNKITFVKNGKNVTYEYDMNGKSTTISSEPTRVLTPKN